MWVRSEYAGELAVLSVWANALIPWSLSAASKDGASLVVVRFQLFLVKYLLGVSLDAQERPIQSVVSAVSFETGAVSDAYRFWLAGAAVFALALLASVVYYAADDWLEATSPVDPVRLLGGLLVLAGAAETVAAVRLWGVYPGTLVPVGVLFCYLLGGLLLVVDRT
ncbi:MAG: hypothetical protein ABEJ23_08630 [Haloarculaceae archaeon]